MNIDTETSYFAAQTMRTKVLLRILLLMFWTIILTECVHNLMVYLMEIIIVQQIGSYQWKYFYRTEDNRFMCEMHRLYPVIYEKQMKWQIPECWWTVIGQAANDFSQYFMIRCVLNNFIVSVFRVTAPTLYSERSFQM